MPERDIADVLSDAARNDIMWARIQDLFMSTDTYLLDGGYGKATVTDGLMAISDALNRIADGLEARAVVEEDDE